MEGIQKRLLDLIAAPAASVPARLVTTDWGS